MTPSKVTRLMEFAAGIVWSVILAGVVAVFTIVGTGCMSSKEQGDNTFLGDRSFYAKDKRTELCFFFVGHTVTYVPCTPEVEKILVNK